LHKLVSDHTRMSDESLFDYDAQDINDNAQERNDNVQDGPVAIKHEPVICNQCGRKIFGDEKEHTEEHMSPIVPGLYVGAVYNAYNAEELRVAGIDTIVSMASELHRKPFGTKSKH
jgi:hypothetical protein